MKLFSGEHARVVVDPEVDWPDADDIYHNVFSISDTAPFDLGLYKPGTESKKLVFDRAGRVDVFCSIHAQVQVRLPTLTLWIVNRPVDLSREPVEGTRSHAWIR